MTNSTDLAASREGGRTAAEAQPARNGRMRSVLAALRGRPANAAEAEKRREAALARRAAREEARSRWAQRALAVPTVVWMESILWFCTVAALGVAYALSYSHQSGVFAKLDYGGWEHMVAPLALDLPLTASVAGLYLAARWKSPWQRRWTFRGMTVLTAPLSLGANALHGSVDAGHVDWARVIEPVHLVSSLIPAIIVLACVFGAEVTFSEHARLDELGHGRPSTDDPPPEGFVEGGAPTGAADRSGDGSTSDRREPERRPQRHSNRSMASGSHRPSIERVRETIDKIAAEQSIPPWTVSSADINESLFGKRKRDLSTYRPLYRSVLRSIDRSIDQPPIDQSPMRVVGEEDA